MPAPTPDRSELLVTPQQLASELGGVNPPVLLDVRWRIDRPDGHDDYLAGHLPGAVYVSLDDELAEHGAPTDGRHPLPSAERLAAASQRWGMTPDSAVVVYDDALSWAASRAWWMLRAAGLGNVRVLDGGLSAWQAAGLPLEMTVPRRSAEGISGTLGAMPSLSIDEAAAWATDGQLLDARAPERYRGEVEPLDPKAGHIPGALNSPVSRVFDERGQFLSAQELQAQFADLGFDSTQPVGVYCGSGVSATPLVLALTLAGYQPALYPGSWSQWSNQPDRPVATGSEPASK